MRIPALALTSLCLATLFAGGCAQPVVYTEPFVTVDAASLSQPLAVSLDVTYTKDGKRDGKREQELKTSLRTALSQGRAFRVVDDASSTGRLSLSLQDVAEGQTHTLLGAISASVGHVFAGQQEFTPQGRRTARDLHLEIRYVPGAGAPLDQSYMSKLVTVTNNTQDPTDLVPLQDRKHAELILIENDLNAFAAGLVKSPAPATP